MPILKNYTQFNGRHWETGTVRNYFDYIGVKAPHTARPYSEALLMGISGGVAMGYFSFAYEGYDPHARILTRSTFAPFDTMLSRLGVVQNVQQTNKPEKGVANLVAALEEGLPAIVWADMWSLPYNALSYDDGMWAMFPILVYGYDETADQVCIADRAHVPLTITTAELAAARGRVKKDKSRLMTLEPPLPEKLPSAVQLGIWDCLKLFTEKPPKGSRNNFGLQAYRWWAELLTKSTARLSWEKEFPAGRKMLSGLTNAFGDINIFGKQGHAERDVYADFLEEAAVLLHKPALTEAAAHFRRSATAWDALSLALLPDEVAPFKETRELMLRRRELFNTQGNGAVEEMKGIDGRLEVIMDEVARDFPLDARGVTAVRQNIADHMMHIHDIESEAIAALKVAMQ
ncbi:MAG: DUF4872 domain-containing protein [Anaerolineae bacterium]|nr:DUF4872 domain-containing protein [Anaerolineae bacterium]